jgi:hypothetical protein
MSDIPESYTPEPFQPYNPYDRQISSELLKANENFKLLAKAFKNNDPATLELNYSVYALNSTISYNYEVLSPLQIPYSRLFIQTTPPQNPQLFDSWFNNDPLTYSLSYYNGEQWVNVDYLKSLVFGSDETPFDMTCFYSMGKMVEVMADDGNPADDFKIIRLMPGQSLVIRGDKTKIRLYPPYMSFYQCNAVFSDAIVGVFETGAIGINPDIEGYLPNTEAGFFATGTTFTTYGEFFLTADSYGSYSNPGFFDTNFNNITTTYVGSMDLPRLGYLPIAYYPDMLHGKDRMLFCSFTLNVIPGFLTSFSVNGAINSATITHGVLRYNPSNPVRSLGTFSAQGLNHPAPVKYAVFTRIR